MACGCAGKKAGAAPTRYEVTTRTDGKHVVDTITEVRTVLRNGGGGTYKAVSGKVV